MADQIEKTLVILKPDALQRGLIGKIMERFEQKGLKLVGLKMAELSNDTLDQHYAHHHGKPFFEGLKSFMQSAPAVLMVWEGVGVISAVRLLCGTTKSREAEAGSIRGDFGMSMQRNLIHASDSLSNAEKEIGLFFSEIEIYEWSRQLTPSLYSQDEVPH